MLPACSQEATQAADVTRQLVERGVSAACQELVVGLLAPQEAARLSVGAALQHPWLTAAPTTQPPATSARC